MDEEVKIEKEEDKKNSLIKFVVEHPKTVFAIRLVLFVLFAVIIPVLFITYRYDLFKPSSGTSLTGWGILVIIIIGVFFLSVIKILQRGLRVKHVFAAQCISGVCKVIIPLLVLFIILKGISSNVDSFLQVLGCTILCEMFAIPINPLPKWVFDQQKELRAEERKNTVDYLVDSFFSKKKESDK